MSSQSVIVLVSGDVSSGRFDSFWWHRGWSLQPTVPVKFQVLFQLLRGEARYQQTIAAKRFSSRTRTSPPTCTTVYNRCTPRPVSGHQHAALSHRGRQRGRLPRARGRQDRQEGAQPQALGGRRGAALQYIQPSLLTLAAVHVYSRLVLFIPYHSLLNYIRLPLYLTPSTY